MHVAFPKPSQIRDEAVKTGFVARAAMSNGQRPPRLDVGIFDTRNQREVELRDFGWIAGRNIVHINSGLHFCAQIAIFDLKNGIGASSHFEADHLSNGSGPTPADLQKDVAEMADAMAQIGADPQNLLAHCVFGIGAEQPGDVRRILTTLRAAGIPVAGANACRNGDEIYYTNLSSGNISYSPATSDAIRTVFAAEPAMKDRAELVLGLFDQAEQLRQDSCGIHGKTEFNEFLLPRLAALFFNDGNKFMKIVAHAAELGADKTTKTIGDFFKRYFYNPV